MIERSEKQYALLALLATGILEKTDFDIVVASEVMAIFCLATSLVGFKRDV